MVFGPPRGGVPQGRFMPSAKSKNAKKAIFRLISMYKEWIFTIALVITLTVIGSGISIFIPYLTGRAFDAFNIHNNTLNQSLLLKMLFAIAAAHILSWIINTLRGVIMVMVSQKLVYTLRVGFFDKMQKLPLNFYDTRSHGDSMSRITNDVDNISAAISQTTTQLISSALTILGTIVMMVILNIPLTIAVFCSVPFIAFLTKIIATKSRVYFSAQQRTLGILNGIIEENITGLKVVKAFQQQDKVMEEFELTTDELYRNSVRAQIWSGFMMPLSNVINNLIFAFVAILGGILASKGQVSIGVVVTFLTYSKHFTGPLNGIANMFNSIQSSLASADRVFEIFDQIEEKPDICGAVDIVNITGNVRFKDVSFSYDKVRPILKNISFDIKAGEVVAFVGETGAGKTTIVNLLTRFYDADCGNIYIDGIDITSIKRDSLRNCFSVVLQDTSLFSGTIMDNIRYARSGATDSEVINAAKIAHANKFIERLPNKYNTIVSGSIDNLSEGQRQLLAIARAVLCKSPILILDEATSSVDTKTEKDIQRALIKLMEDHTSFLIAHRLSTIRDADRIIVVGNGEIIESGNHDTLMAKRGEYYKMVKSQLGEYVP